MENKTKTSVADDINDGLKKPETDMEEYRVQVALGKAEAHDAYEEAKKKMRHAVHEAQQMFGSSKEAVTDAATQLKTIIETLQVQLALGRADTRDAFEAQRKKIMQALHDLEVLMESEGFSSEYYGKLQTEIAKFKIKLEILQLRFELNKMEARDDFEQKKKEFADKIETIAQALREKEKQAAAKWKNFREDVSEAYNDVRKAFID